MTSHLALLWLAAFPLMGSPGPATLSLAGIGTGFGFRPGLRYLCGIILGTFSVLLLIATGVTVLILEQPALVTGLTVIAAAYILYLAWRIASAPVGVTDTSALPVPSLFSGFALAIANPKAFAAVGAVYSSHTLVPDSLAADSIAKVAALTLVILVVNTLWLAFGASFSRFLSDPRLGRMANIVFALLLVVSVLFAILSL